MTAYVFDLSGNNSALLVGDPATATEVNVNASSKNNYVLASAIASLAGTTGTTPVTNVASGAYVWSYVFGGTTPSLILQTLGPDGLTWQNVATVTASGSQGVVIGTGASVRLYNNTANAITGLSSNLS